jgi:hypothetical protein
LLQLDKRDAYVAEPVYLGLYVLIGGVPSGRLGVELQKLPRCQAGDRSNRSR